MVNLLTSDASIVSVPSPTLTIPAGSSTVQFPATAQGAGTTAVYVTVGTFGGLGQFITVTP